MASTRVSRATRNQKHGILPRSIQANAHRSFIKSGIVTCSRTPPFSMRIYIAMFRHFQGLQLFRIFNLPTIVAHFPSLALSLNWPSLVTCYASSDLPIPLFTNWFTSSLLLISLSPNPDFQRGKLGILELRTCKSPVAPSSTCRA